jgi:hypothetical protein
MVINTELVCIGQNVVPVIRIQSTLYFKNKTIHTNGYFL